MDTQIKNGESIKIDNKKLEHMIDEVIADNRNIEKLSAMIQEIKTTSLIVPMTFPQDTPVEIVQKIMQRQPVPADKRPPMLQLFVNDPQGNRLLPVFTDLAQVTDPKNFLGQKFFMMMKFPAEKVIEMVTNEKSDIKGLLVNPQTQKFIIRDKAFTSFTADGKLKRKEVKMTPTQFAVFSRKNVEQAILPRTVFQEKADFMARIEADQGKYMAALFAKPYGGKIECPYKEEDFSVMVLNVDAETTVACIEMPEKNLMPGFAIGVYVVYKSATGKIYYYTIEKGEPGQNNVVCNVTPKGEHNELQTAPPVGSELSAVLELIREEEEEAGEDAGEEVAFPNTPEIVAEPAAQPEAVEESAVQEEAPVEEDSTEEASADSAAKDEKSSRRRFFKRVK